LADRRPVAARPTRQHQHDAEHENLLRGRQRYAEPHNERPTGTVIFNAPAKLGSGIKVVVYSESRIAVVGDLTRRGAL
jgi:hypothetical protein